MRKLLAFLLCVIMAVSVLAACTPADNSGTGDAAQSNGAGTFRVGFGCANITPNPGFALAGLGDEDTRLAVAVETPLLATCIAITDEQDNTLLLLTADNLHFEKTIADEMRTTISTELGVPRENIISSATHSHNTPDSVDPAYTKILKDGCLEACKLAMKDRKTAEMFTGTTQSDGLNFVRQYLMSDGSYAGPAYGDADANTYVEHETPVDNDVQLIKFTREGGKDVVLMNWRAHPIATGSNYTKYSAGYVGYCRTEMEKTLGCSFAYFQGASGNVADYSEIAGEEKFLNMKDQGKKLAQCAIDYMDQLEKVEIGLIEIKTVNYNGNVRVDSQEYIDAANTFKAMIDAGKTKAEAIAAAGGLCNTTYAVSGIKNRQDAYAAGNGKYSLELAAISIGDVAFVSAPYEMFDNSGKQLKEGSPYEQTFVLSQANGYAKYIASEPGYSHGCTSKENSYFVKGTAEELVSVYVDMLKEIHKDGTVDPTITTFDSKLPNDT